MDEHPHHVVALALDGSVLLDVAIPVHVFGDYGAPHYRFTLAGCQSGPVVTSTGVRVWAQAGPEALEVADTVVVPGYVDVLRPPPQPVLAALRAASARGARVMAICTGAYTLAYAGLLDGRRATTHWSTAGLLAERFPEVTVDPNVLYVDEGRILTSAGVAAGLGLCLHVVRLDHGAATAASIARHTVVAPHRDGTTPLRWVLSQRVLRARELLEETGLAIEEVARACGFASAPHLRRHFTRATGITPSAYRRAFSLRG